jgi:hypothetical protein
MTTVSSWQTCDTNYMAMLPCNYVAQEHEDELKVKECA